MHIFILNNQAKYYKPSIVPFLQYNISSHINTFPISFMYIQALKEYLQNVLSDLVLLFSYKYDKDVSFEQMTIACKINHYRKILFTLIGCYSFLIKLFMP